MLYLFTSETNLALYELLLFSPGIYRQLSWDSSHPKEQYLGKKRAAKISSILCIRLYMCMWGPEANARCLSHWLSTIFLETVSPQ